MERGRERVRVIDKGLKINNPQTDKISKMSKKVSQGNFLPESLLTFVRGLVLFAVPVPFSKSQAGSQSNPIYKWVTHTDG